MSSDEVLYDSANEVVVLRSAVVDVGKRRALVHALSDSEFLVPQHAAVFRALRVLSDKGLEYSRETMRDLLLRGGEDPDDMLLAELESGEEPVNIEHHVESLRWDATRARVLTGPITELLKELKDPGARVESVVASARAVLRSIEGGGGRKYIRRSDELRRSYRAELAERRKVRNFFPTGYAAMDKLLVAGIAPGKTSVFSGLSGSGKSTLGANLAVRLAKQGRRVLFCAWEMSPEDLLDVMAASMTGVELETIVQGTLSDDDAYRVDRAVKWLTERIKFMENAFFEKVRSGKRSNERNQDVLEGYVAESGCDVLLMDLWERMLADLSYEGVTLALYRQQQMHKEYRVHGAIFQQLRLKDVEKRSDKRPTREAIKGVGAFVEVADLIIGVHRDAQFKAVPDDSIEAICLKQRMGRPNWAVRFGWLAETAQVDPENIGGEEVPYDPGLDSSELGDVGDVRTRPRNGMRKDKIGRRDP